MTESVADRLLAAIEGQQAAIVEQGRQIAQQSEQVALLVQAVMLLLGEEVGMPVAGGEEAPEGSRTDLDGNRY